MAKGAKRLQDDAPEEGVSYMMKIACVEFLGTMFLLFLGCLGCTSGLVHKPSPLQPALVFGFAVASIIQMFGHISRAHLNPAISLAAVILRVISWKLALVYTAAQCLGAIVGYGLIKVVTPENVLKVDIGENGFCTTVPSNEISTFQAIFVEFMATAVLIFVLCGSWDRRNDNHHDSVAIKFGLVIAALALAVGPYTGASMNPARSLGPAFWNGVWKSHWIYWFSPLTSAAVVSFFYRYVLEEPRPTPLQSGAEVPLNSANTDENGIGQSHV